MRICCDLVSESTVSDHQHWFRTQRSYEPQPVQFVHDLTRKLDGAVNGGHKQTNVIIMDFTKTFDNIPHRGSYLYKLDLFI